MARSRGIGSLSQELPRQAESHTEFSHQQLMSDNQSKLNLSIGNERKNQYVSHDEERSRFQRLPKIHTDPHSLSRFANQQTVSGYFPPFRASDDWRQGIRAHRGCAAVEANLTFSPVWDLQAPPRVHVRSSSAFPKSSDIGTGTDSAGAQFDRRRRVNSQPAPINAPGRSSLNHTLHSNAKGIWVPANRSSEECTSESSSEHAPLLRGIRKKIASDAAACRSQETRFEGSATDEGANECRQHIGQCKGLWFVVIASLVGIFLCLFMYAFHIIK